jgi:hypothetical protein
MVYRPRSPLAVVQITTNGHWMVGVEWTVVGSKGDKYIVTMHDKGFTCECMAFERKGMLCKHIMQVVDKIIGHEDSVGED